MRFYRRAAAAGGGGRRGGGAGGMEAVGLPAINSINQTRIIVLPHRRPYNI